MLLLYHSEARRSIHNHLHLHSTMLLLYRFPLPVPIFRVHHLHSTMLLLYHVLGQRRTDVRQNLHSTMLLLYPITYNLFAIWRYIYIPLCFYFISRAHHPPWALCRFTFHYASTLSIPLSTYSRRWSAFTFHYASTLSVGQGLDLCRDTIFTFHYASTLSWSPSLVSVETVKFTFHYASTLSVSSCMSYESFCFIYIPLCFYFIIDRQTAKKLREQDLHSTMLLLYHNPHAFTKSFLEQFTFHYASTLSDSGRIHTFRKYVFTFHYASTLSCCACSLCV